MDRIQWYFYGNGRKIDVTLPEEPRRYLIYDPANKILKARPKASQEDFPWTVSQASPGSDLLL